MPNYTRYGMKHEHPRLSLEEVIKPSSGLASLENYKVVLDRMRNSAGYREFKDGTETQEMGWERTKAGLFLPMK